MKILIFLVMFFMFSALLIISNNDLALIEDDNFSQFISLYTDWLDGTYKNVQILTGEAVKLGWVPD